MLIPSVDLLGGKIVQLVQGEKLALEISDFEPWIKRFEKYPLVHVVDLDAARREGSNRKLVEQLSQRLPCQVGGGVSSAEMAREFLAAGAKRVVVGSAVVKGNQIDLEFAGHLAKTVGSEKVVYSVDTRNGLLVVSGWRKTVNITIKDAVTALAPYCVAFMHTHLDVGELHQLPLTVARELTEVTDKHLIIGGGISTLEEVAELDSLGVDAVVGMAIYSGQIPV